MPHDRKKYSKTKAIQIEEFDDITNWWTNRKETDWAWKVNIKDIVKESDKGTPIVNLDIKNPNKKSEFEYHEPKELVQRIVEREKMILSLKKKIQELLLNKWNYQLLTDNFYVSTRSIFS